MDITENTLKKENVWLGALGAFLFSLIGAAIYFLLNAVGLIESLSGFFAVFCAINGYAIFAKRESKRGIIISLVIAAVVITLSWFFCFCFTTVEQINKEASTLPESLRYSTSLGEFLPHSFDVIAENPKLLISLGLSLAFGALGYISHVNGLFYSEKSRNKRQK